jgi:hypothetical protein
MKRKQNIKTAVICICLYNKLLYIVNIPFAQYEKTILLKLTGLTCHACEGRHPEIITNTGFPPARE